MNVFYNTICCKMYDPIDLNKQIGHIFVKFDPNMLVIVFMCLLDKEMILYVM